MRRRLGGIGVATALAVLATASACWSVAGPGSGPEPGPAAERSVPAVVLPTPNVGWDYQIGGGFTPAPTVGIVARDRNDDPSAGDYSICYVNAFQTQPDERRFWVDDPAHRRLLLEDADGDPVVDGAWGEFLLDTRTSTKRRALVAIVGRWIDGCAEDGFDAVELDNLDSWGRSHGLVTRSHNKAFARVLTARAHRAGLAAGQKNWAGLSPDGPGIGFDFAVAEECGRYHECGAYARAYDDRVLVVEYRDPDFATACEAWGPVLSIVRRNLNVTPGGVNRRC